MEQTFLVVYQNEHIYIDPTLLSNASEKFRELISLKEQNYKSFCLKILYDGFSVRNICNFLKICQGLQTDVQNFELEEICLIAKMFHAYEILNSGLNFIQTQIDKSFYIQPDLFEEIDEKKYLILEEVDNEVPKIIHCDFNELEFDDSCENIEIETKNNNKRNQKKKHHSVCYQIKTDNKFMKCPHFYLIKENKVIYMAKLKFEEIYIGEGENFHISENKLENTAKITRDYKGYNIVSIDDQEFKIKYLKFGSKFSLKVSFEHCGKKKLWRPKQTDSDNIISGEFQHKPLKSNKNLILQNPQNHPTFILRKMSKKTYEVECNPNINPITAFSIALSQIIGPISM